MNKLVAINRKKHQAVVKYGSHFITIDTQANDVVDVKTSFPFSALSGWTAPHTEEIPQKWNDLAVSTLASFDVLDSPDVPSYKVFRVPERIKDDHPLVASGKVSMGELVSFHDSPSFAVASDDLTAWVRKIIEGNPTFSKGSEPTIQFFGLSSEPGIIKRIFAKTEDGTVQELDHNGRWNKTDSLPSGAFTVDGETVLQATSGVVDLSIVDPDEFGTCIQAMSELDMEFLDRLDSVFDIYDSQERSANAQKQVRGPGGKFGEKPDAGSATKVATEVLAKLPKPLPLVEDINALIDNYLAGLSSDAAQTPQGSNKPPKKAPAPKELAVTADQVPTTKTEPLYVAIVDNIAADAVLEVVALVPPDPAVGGDVSSWIRRNGQWIAEPSIVQALRGSNPPPIVHLSEPDVIKTVIEQVDFATKDAPVEEVKAPGQTEVAEDGKPVTAPLIQEAPSSSQIGQGFALADGSYFIRNSEDLKRCAFVAQSPEEILHVTKRAFALNRMDLIPSEWRSTEALVAAGGADRNRGGAEKLRRYWMSGPGAAKIRWRTPGDWTRCVAQLSKYLGPRAKGYCALRHKEANGYWPGSKKNR